MKLINAYLTNLMAAPHSAAQRLAAWQTLQQQFVPWQQNALSWQQALFAQTDAVSRLDDFIQSLDNVSV